MSDVIYLVVLIAPIIGIWVLFIRPAQRRAQERAQIVSALHVGQDVVTTSGLYGTITGLDDESVLLAVAPGVEMRFDRRAVGQVRRDDDLPPEDAAE